MPHEEEENFEETNESFHCIVMWCSEGLECIIPIDMDKLSDGGDMLAKLEGVKNEYPRKINQTLSMLSLRARMNSQRNYEIYKLETDGITKETLEQCFEDNPQGIVNLIREKGVKIFGEKLKTKPVII